ncbi:MAG: hypothetical protein ACFFAE_17935 [Candidatus Hodarchaeota archaeon]
MNRKQKGNGTKRHLNPASGRKDRSSRKIVHKYNSLGVRSVWCGSFQYDGVYTLNQNPRN